MDKLNAYFERWFEAALIRAIKTMAQTAVAMIGTTALMSAVDWKTVISTAVLSGILSMLTSLAGLPEVKQDGENNRRK
jgi:hypothetical protein